jgi:cytochrome c-type biogenesis protein CcmH/NrfG
MTLRLETPSLNELLPQNRRSKLATVLLLGVSMRRFLVLIPLLMFFSYIPASAQQSVPNLNSRRARFSISGTLRDSGDNRSIEGAKVDLRAVTGATIGSSFTGVNGGFQFDGIPGGSYIVAVQQAGYDPVNEQVQVGDASIFGMQIELHRNGASGPVPGHGQATVSAHELSAPRKAQEAMAKGTRLLYDKSEYGHSITEFQRAILAYPTYYEAYAQMGIAYVNMGDMANAEQAFRKSYELSDGKYVSACFLLAKLLTYTQRFADAEPIARRGLETDPQSWQSSEELSRALLGQHRAAEAEQYARAAVDIQPKEPRLQILLADIHLETRNYEAMLGDLEKYLELAPNGTFAAKAKETRDKLKQGLANAQAAPAPANR